MAKQPPSTRKKASARRGRSASVRPSPSAARARTSRSARPSTVSGRPATRSARPATGSNNNHRHLVIVESPTKAKTINKYLGDAFLVMASVGHVRDLPSRAPKGQKQEVPGVDLENDFQPTYEILPAKKKTVAELRRAAKAAADVWFATDLDREGEAIAWHLAQALGLDPDVAKRVVFNAITKSQIEEAFHHPRKIDEHKVNAQQARRILDRIVGYQVSPLLWKKVAGGLSAGRVQSVAVRLVVEREREIEAFIPEELWRLTGYFATDLEKAPALAESWSGWLGAVENGKSRTNKEKLVWLSERGCLKSELVELNGRPFKPTDSREAIEAAKRIGLLVDKIDRCDDPKGKGPAAVRFTVQGHPDPALYPGGSRPAAFAIRSIQTKRTKTRPGPPFITSTLQQAAANYLGFPLKRTMRIAQQLYEGVDIGGGEGQVGLITYMRTDSTFVASEALATAREYIGGHWGSKYLPEKPNFYTTKVKAAQEAHEAIRPTDVRIIPSRVRSSLTREQFKVYELIWNRFVSSQMVPAEWDSTTVMISAFGPAAGASGNAAAAQRARKEIGVFKATGRTLAFDGFYKASGVPNNGDEALLPPLREDQPLAPIQIDPTQHFTSPPPRYTEASLQKKLEEEGIGRPSTYATIISTIQDRKYAAQVGPQDRRLRATDLGRVVTDKLVEAFPNIMDVAYTRYMEEELDKVEAEHHDWKTMLQEFYDPFRTNLDRAHDEMVHAKAETEPAPHRCQKCGAATVYRFGRNGRFLSCAEYPKCDYGAPIDAEGNPMEPERTDIACPDCGSAMTRRTGRFGPFLGCVRYPECKGILNIDPKKGTIKLPKVPPFLTDLPCPKCAKPLNLRDSKRGFWLSCSRFPKCRGRMAWSAVPEEKKKALAAAWDAHVAENPLPKVRTVDGRPVGEEHIPQVVGDETPPSENGFALEVNSVGERDTDAA